jgi:protein-S-isoprenylcysteine O-methyltransferase Ste14
MSEFFNKKSKEKVKVMDKNLLYRFQVVISILFLVAYFTMLAAMFFVEVSDTLNMVKGENSLMSLLEVLLGVLTAGVGQVLNYWLGDRKNNSSEVE